MHAAHTLRSQRHEPAVVPHTPVGEWAVLAPAQTPGGQPVLARDILAVNRAGIARQLELAYRTVEVSQAKSA